MKKYLKEKNQSLFWFEIGSKYGTFGEHEPKYKPSFKDFRIAKSICINSKYYGKEIVFFADEMTS